MGPEITFLSEITTTKATSHQLFLVQSFIRPMVLVHVSQFYHHFVCFPLLNENQCNHHMSKIRDKIIINWS